MQRSGEKVYKYQVAIVGSDIGALFFAVFYILAQYALNRNWPGLQKGLWAMITPSLSSSPPFSTVAGSSLAPYLTGDSPSPNLSSTAAVTTGRVLSASASSLRQLHFSSPPSLSTNPASLSTFSRPFLFSND